MGRYRTHSAEETAALGEKLAKSLCGGEVIVFTGGLGAGKTTFCQGLGRGLCVKEPIQSPTYTLVNVYEGRLPFAHFDAWRMAGEEDLEAAGFYDWLAKGAVAAVEWSEKVAPFLGESLIRVDIRPGGGEVRDITIEGAKEL